MNRSEVLEELLRRTKYAQNSYNDTIVYEVYGACKMALYLKAIEFADFITLNDMLIHDCINNPEWMRKVRRGEI